MTPTHIPTDNPDSIERFPIQIRLHPFTDVKWLEGLNRKP